MGNMKVLEEGQLDLGEQVRGEMLETMKQQQSILNTLNKVSEKIDRLELVQQPQLIYEPPRISVPKRSHSKELNNRKARRSHSADRVNRGRGNVNKKMYTSSTESFSKRLSGSVEKYFDRIKRDPLEHRNVER